MPTMSNRPTSGEQARGGRLRHAVVVRGRDEVGGDQAVGGRAADREAAGEQPERPGPAEVREHAAGRPRRRSSPHRRAAWRRDASAAAVRRRGRRSAGWSRRNSRRTPAVRPAAQRRRRPAPPSASRGAGRERGEQRQEDELAGRAGRGEDAGDQAAAAVTNQRPVTVAHEDQRHRRRCRAPTSTPQQQDSCHGAVMKTRQPAAGGDEQQRDGDDPAHAEPVHQGGGERRGEAEEQQVDRDGGRDRAARPAELRPAAASIRAPGVARKPAAPIERDEGDRRPPARRGGSRAASVAGRIGHRDHHGTSRADARDEWPDGHYVQRIRPCPPVLRHRTASPSSPCDGVVGFDLGDPAAGVRRGPRRAPATRCTRSSSAPLTAGALATSAGYPVLPDHGPATARPRRHRDRPRHPMPRAARPPATLPAGVADALARCRPGTRIDVDLHRRVRAGRGRPARRPPATTHWAYADRFRRLYPAVELDPDVLFVDDGDVLTSAGVAAGIDLCLHVIRRDHGTEVANRGGPALRRPAVARRAGRRSSSSVRSRLPVGASTAAARDWALAQLGEPLDLADHGRAGPDERADVHPAVPRRDRAEPGAWLVEQRVDQARLLLETTDLPVDEVAAAGRASAPPRRCAATCTPRSACPRSPTGAPSAVPTPAA